MTRLGLPSTLRSFGLSKTGMQEALNKTVNATAEEFLAMIQLFPRGSALPSRYEA